MKKAVALVLLIILLNICFLSACQPTPDHDIIVNKAEATIPVVRTPKPASTPASDADSTEGAADTEQPSATVSPINLPEGDPKAGRANIPEHVKLEADPQSSVHIVFDTDVNIDREGEFPVVEVKQKRTWSDPFFIKRMVSLVFPEDTVIYDQWPNTKAELAENLAAAISYNDELGAIISIDKAFIEQLQKEFANAPDDAVKTVADIDRLEEGNYIIEFSDGMMGILECYSRGDSENNEFGGCLDKERYRIYFPGSSFFDDKENPIPTPSVINEAAKEEALRTADSFMNAMGFNEYILENAEEYFGIDTNNYIATSRVWRITYCRKVGSSHSLKKWNSEVFYKYKNSRSVVGNPWGAHEYIIVYVDKAGVTGVFWQTLTEPVQVITEDVPFLDFDEMIQRITSQFGYEYAGNNRTYTISSIDLVYGLISEKNTTDRGLYIPLWQLTYTESGSELTMRYFFSAIDGSVVEPRIQTNLGGY